MADICFAKEFRIAVDTSDALLLRVSTLYMLTSNKSRLAFIIFRVLCQTQSQSLFFITHVE